MKITDGKLVFYPAGNFVISFSPTEQQNGHIFFYVYASSYSKIEWSVWINSVSVHLYVKLAFASFCLLPFSSADRSLGVLVVQP